MTLQHVPLENLLPNPWQTRERADPDYIRELAADIGERGLLQGVQGRAHATLAGKVELAFGHNRLAAYKLLHKEHPERWATFPVDVLPLTDLEMSDRAAAENGARKDLSPIEVARAIRRRMDDFKLDKLTAAAPFHIGSRPGVDNLLSLLKLPPAVQAHVAAGELPQRFARAMVKPAQSFPQVMAKLADDLVKKDPARREGDFPWMLDSALQGKAMNLSAVPWKLSWPEQPIAIENHKSLKSIPACEGCEWHFTNRGTEYCLNKSCFVAKQIEHGWATAPAVAQRLGMALGERAGGGTDLLRGMADTQRGAQALATKHASLRIVPAPTGDYSVRYARRSVVNSEIHTLVTLDLAGLNKAIAALPAARQPRPPVVGVNGSVDYEARRRKEQAERKEIERRARVVFEAALPAFARVMPANMPGAAGLVELILIALRLDGNMIRAPELAAYRQAGTSVAKQVALARLLLMRGLMYEPATAFHPQDVKHMAEEIAEHARALKLKLPAGWDGAAAPPKPAAKKAAKKATAKKRSRFRGNTKPPKATPRKKAKRRA